MDKKYLSAWLSTLGIVNLTLGSLITTIQSASAVPLIFQIGVVDSLFQKPVINSDVNELRFEWTSNADFSHVRYRTANGETQVKIKPRSGGLYEFPFTKINLNNSTYLIKVQACESHFLARSTCTPWRTVSYTIPTAPKPYGVDTCNQGYVWREAQPDDRVCVTPAIRTQTRNENNLAAQRREPNGGAYGPNTCKQGYVWREATTNDPVCVTPQVRAQAADDNKRAGERRVP